MTDLSHPRRPTDLAGMKEVMSRYGTQESHDAGLAYRADPSDVFISPYAKCGTTWMQQIVHGLRTGGSMAFDEITAVVPWLEMARDLGIDPKADPVAAPKAFKSHLTYDAIPKGGRYIIVFRDPKDACLSLFRFFEGWFFEAGSISLETFATEHYLARKESGYWAHMASWLRQRDRETVLLLCFEDLKQDLPAAVRRVAAFLDLPKEGPVYDIALRQAGFDFMKAHDRQFDDHLLRDIWDRRAGLPADGSATKVSEGKSGSGKPLLSADIQALFDARWRETITEEFGIPDYAALRDFL